MFALVPGRMHVSGPQAASASHPSSAPFASSFTSGRAAKSAAAASASAALESSMRDCASASPGAWPTAAASSSGAVAAAAPMATGSAAPPSCSSRGTTSSLRLAKDMAELSLHKMTAAASTRISFPDGQKNLRRLQVLLTPHSGLYAQASFLFTLTVPPAYPFQPPAVRCHTPCLHPNINWRTGKVHLHLLKSDWKPVLSINTVLFALQLLFLEPWPASSSHSATASSMPPARPTLSATHSIPPTGTALTLAASRSAAASNLHQLDEGGILNLEIHKLIVGGERAVFEELVRKTLDGGFFFGSLWPRNRAAQHDSDSDSDNGYASDGSDADGGGGHKRNRRAPSPVDESRYDPRHMFAGGGRDDSVSAHDSGFDALLRRVEQNGRQAHVGIVRPQQREPQCGSKDDHAMDGNGEGRASAAAVASQRKFHPLAGTGAGTNDGKGLQKRSKRLLHRKRAHRLISSSDAHEHNPASALCSSPASRILPPGSDLPAHVHKRIRSQQLDQQHKPAPSKSLRVAATSRHRLIQLRQLDSSSAASAHGPSAGTRKRPSPAPQHASPYSDGEYDDEGEVVAVVARGVRRFNASPVTAQDDSSAAPPRRRRTKKQFRPVAAEEDAADCMHEPMGSFGMGASAVAAAAVPRPSSTVLPDLASFASFRPTTQPGTGRSASASPTAAAGGAVVILSSSPTNDGTHTSNSPKRNVSDCGSLMPALRPLDDRGARYGSAADADPAASSFLLHGRSSSRSLNLFGPVKAQVVHAGAGLADLHDLQASLPAAAANAMTD